MKYKLETVCLNIEIVTLYDLLLSGKGQTGWRNLIISQLMTCGHVLRASLSVVLKKIVPKSNAKKGCKTKPQWMTANTLDHLRRKRHAWSR